MELTSCSVVEISVGSKTADFDCGNQLLNNWLASYALAANSAHSTKVYVLENTSKSVLGYYALSMGQIEFEAGTSRMKKGLGRYPIPIVLITRLAVDKSVQGLGVGVGLLREAVMKALIASVGVGAVGIAVNPIDEMARNFYLRFGFEESPINDGILMIRFKDLRIVLSI